MVLTHPANTNPADPGSYSVFLHIQRREHAHDEGINISPSSHQQAEEELELQPRSPSLYPHVPLYCENGSFDFFFFPHQFWDPKVRCWVRSSRTFLLQHIFKATASHCGFYSEWPHRCSRRSLKCRVPDLVASSHSLKVQVYRTAYK